MIKKIIVFAIAVTSFMSCAKDDALTVLALTSDSVVMISSEGGEYEITYSLDNPVEGVELDVTGGYFTIEDNGDGTHAVTIDCHDDAEPQNRVTAAKSCNKYLKNRKY